MIEARGLVKRYGPTTAVDNLSFDVRPGTVTGFLGPNGAGKSTTMRMLLGLDRPDAGTARINGKNYHDLRWPLREVGALLEAKAFHPGRSARAHLTALAVSNGIPRRRVNDVLEITGMQKAAERRGQRAGPGGHPLDPRPAEEPGLARPHRAHLQSPDQRDRADRGPADRDRPGPAAGPDHGR
jgi:ABC-2 type transport system ATP-binding protein